MNHERENANGEKLITCGKRRSVQYRAKNLVFPFDEYLPSSHHYRSRVRLLSNTVVLSLNLSSWLSRNVICD